MQSTTRLRLFNVAKLTRVTFRHRSDATHRTTQLSTSIQMSDTYRRERITRVARHLPPSTSRLFIAAKERLSVSPWLAAMLPAELCSAYRLHSSRSQHCGALTWTGECKKLEKKFNKANDHLMHHVWLGDMWRFIQGVWLKITVHMLFPCSTPLFECSWWVSNREGPCRFLNNQLTGDFSQ